MAATARGKPSPLDALPVRLSSLLSHPCFPLPVPGSVLFDQDKSRPAYSSFHHLSLKSWREPLGREWKIRGCEMGVPRVER